LESVAKQTGFKQRASIISPESFLNTLFFSNAQSCPTLSEYSIDLEHNISKSVSKQAIDKRFNERTKSMLTYLLQEILQAQIKRRTYSHSYFSEIRIMDSSEFIVSKNLAGVFPGYGGTGREAIAQVQLEYELLGGKVTELSLGSALDADSTAGMKNIDKVPPKALLIRDLGYFSPKVFKEITRQGVYFISRAKAQWSMYEKQGGKLKIITIQDIKDKLAEQKDKYLDIEVVIGEQARTPVRLIANLLTEEQTQKRIKKKKANRGPLSKQAEESSCLNLFVTNIEKEKCSATEVYGLYTLRWQIELIFKTWKSILKLHKIHPMGATRLECVILIKFIWVMLNWSLLKLLEQSTACELSLPKLTRTLLSRSGMLNKTIMENKEMLISWIIKLCEISSKHHRKEYKKGSIKIVELLSDKQ
jgi:hypothetical protein